jgi:hypothetical protein
MLHVIGRLLDYLAGGVEPQARPSQRFLDQAGRGVGALKAEGVAGIVQDIVDHELAVFRRVAGGADLGDEGGVL